jgi:hypothetical protein
MRIGRLAGVSVVKCLQVERDCSAAAIDAVVTGFMLLGLIQYMYISTACTCLIRAKYDGMSLCWCSRV